MLPLESRANDMRSIRDEDLGSHAERAHLSASRCDELELVLAAGRIGYCVLDRAHGTVTASTQFKVEFGWAPDAEFNWQAFQERVRREDRERLAAALAAAVDKGAELDVIVQAEWPQGLTQSVALRGRLVKTGSADRIVITSRNVSAETLAATDEQRESTAMIDHERRLRKGAETANRAKDEFLSVISHELRSPLNAILGWNRILSLKRGDDAEVAAIAPRIEQSAKAQLKMVNDLLDLGRIGTGKLRIEPRPLRLPKLVCGAVDLARPAAAAKGIDLVTELPAEAPQLRADPDRLQQVVASLLSNAIKFTPSSGKITVRLRESPGLLELLVTDTGQGITPELLPWVFDRFRQGDSSSTRHSGGLGLGLTLVREIVALHGGSVSASSAGVGMGATFVVRLPVAQTTPQTRPAANGPDSADRATHRCSLGGLSILVVDDEIDARTVVAETLRFEGASVTVTDSAGAALRHLRADGAYFDIIVTDIGMPEEDGYSLVRKLRALQSGRQTLAIAVTGYVSRGDVEAAMDAGFDMHVAKPVDFDLFVPMVRRMAAARADSQTA